MPIDLETSERDRSPISENSEAFAPILRESVWLAAAPVIFLSVTTSANPLTVAENLIYVVQVDLRALCSGPTGRVRAHVIRQTKFDHRQE